MLVLYVVTATCVRMSNRHLLIISVPGFLRHISAPRSIRALLLSRTCFLPAILSLYVSILASCQGSLHPGFSCQGSLKNSSDSLSEFILSWFCRFSMQNQRVSRTTSHVSVSFNIRIQDVEFCLHSTSKGSLTNILV